MGRDDFHIAVWAIAYRPDELLFTVYYDQERESEVLWTVRLVDWLEERFRTRPQTRRPELSEALAMYRHICAREEAKRESGTPYEQFDAAAGVADRTVRRWRAKLRTVWDV